MQDYASGESESEILMIFFYFWPLVRPKIAKKIAVIQSAASAASAREAALAADLITA